MKGPRIYNSSSPDERRLRLKRKEKKHLQRVHQIRRRRMLTIFAVIIVFLGVQIGVMSHKSKQIDGQVEAAQQSLTKVTRKRKQLATRAKNLKDPAYVDKLIRSKFDYSKANEKVYNLPKGNDNN